MRDLTDQLDDDAWLRATTCEQTKLAVEIATGIVLSNDRSQWPEGMAITIAKAIEAGAMASLNACEWADSFTAYTADPLGFNKKAA